MLAISTPPILDSIDAIYVINLPNRADRRRDIAKQLKRAGLSFASAKVILFVATRPSDPGPWDSIGARGCFLSHLGVLRDAKAKGFDRILILEDDANFNESFLRSNQSSAVFLDKSDWGLVYLGHHLLGDVVPSTNADFAIAPPQTGVMTTHGMMVSRAAIERLVPYLEMMAARPAGDPAGGPMHVDGAYSWFRRAHPEIRTFTTVGEWVVQRSSRSDVAPPSWKEHLPFIGAARRIYQWVREQRPAATAAARSVRPS